MGYCAVFFRDSTGQIGYTLQVLAAKQTYFSTHENLSVNDFSGIFLQITANGNVRNTLGAENGRIVGSFDVPRGSGSNLLDPCNCGSWDDMWRAIYDELGGSGGWGYREFNINYGDIGENPYGPPSGGGGQYFPPVVINTEIDNTLFDIAGQTIKFNEFQSIYMFQLGFNDTEFEDLYYRKKLFTSVEFYFNAVGRSTANADAIKNNISFVNESDLFSYYLRFLAGNTAAFSTNKAAGFPASMITTLRRYFNAGFTVQEFSDLFANQSRFAQIDAFFSNAGFTEENKLAVKGFNALMDYDDDFVIANQNRGSKTIKQLVDDSGFPKISAGFLIGLARDNGVGNADLMTASFTRIGRIMEDFVMRSLNIPKNNLSFPHPTNSNISAVIPDGLGEGNVAQYEVDQNGIRRLKSWSAENSVFLDSKFTARREKLIKDDPTTNANGTLREQLSTMIDVLAQKKGVAINNINFPNIKASDHGIASLYIITLFDVGLDPNLIQKAYDNNVNVYKRWITYNVDTKKFEVSGGYEDLTPTTITPPKGITTRKSPGYIDPLLTTKAVSPNWDIQ